jgi:hypothetical protein
MTVPPYEWPTRIAGLLTRPSARPSGRPSSAFIGVYSLLQIVRKKARQIPIGRRGFRKWGISIVDGCHSDESRQRRRTSGRIAVPTDSKAGLGADRACLRRNESAVASRRTLVCRRVADRLEPLPLFALLSQEHRSHVHRVRAAASNRRVDAVDGGYGLDPLRNSAGKRFRRPVDVFTILRPSSRHGAAEVARVEP